MMTGLKTGDEIVGYRIIGCMESAGNTVTLDCDLKTSTKNAGATPTLAVVESATQVSKTASYALDDGDSPLSSVHTVAADQLVYLLITVTTAASTGVDLIEVEVDINRK